MDSDDDYIGQDAAPRSTGNDAQARAFSLDKLPEEFVAFLAKNEIDPAIYTVKDLPRYVRLNPDPHNTITPQELEKELGTKVEPVPGLEAFCKLSRHVKLRNTQASLLKRHRLHQYGRLFKADGTTFRVMRPSAIDTIRARNMAGKKNNATMQFSQNKEPEKRSLSENSSERLGDLAEVKASGGSGQEGQEKFQWESSAKRQKSTVEAMADQDAQTNTTTLNEAEVNYKQEKLVPFYAPKMLRNDPQLQGEGYKYDKVIVDAECTHDGSIAHILKYETWGWDSFHKNFMAQDRLDSLCDIQRGLLLNGFRLTKKGGLVVYSTCSLSRAQNEDIVAWFLAKMRGRAVLEPLPNYALGIPTADCKKPCRSVIASALGLQSAPTSEAGNSHDSEKGEWCGTSEQEAELEQLQKRVMSLCLRYDPITSNTSGFFLARIRNIA
ncbi:hypothetical protein BGZ65_001541 [Modicella reniformis]|uniref:SAM-dependent MTase RsmB/NOP-type domain-containing protein n=1 Tax=Modicella reniformis TaxID=1440133 RepID=A0A9P6SVJ0_9FUNG|nr:hypothetical protein BGZ65_001541 [Modicella reniformis]